MARNRKESFLKGHWEYVVVAAGLALTIGFGAKKALTTVDQPVFEPPAESEPVAEVNLNAPEAALERFERPMPLKPLDAKGSFLASRARTFCTPSDGSAGCGAVLLPDAEKCRNVACGKDQKEASEKLVIDRDEDGMTDEYEIANGLNPELDDRDEDLDGDGFTNYEEFLAKTLPNDPLNHPDYLSSRRPIAKVLGRGEPVTSTLQFVNRGGYDVGDKGRRFTFVDPEIRRKHKNLGTYDMTAFIGEPIVLPRTSRTGAALAPIETGFTLLKYTERKERVKARGVGGEKEVDKSFVTLKRAADGAEFTFELNEAGRARPRKTILDDKARIVFDGVRDAPVFDVGKGDRIDLVAYGVTYTVVKIAPADGAPDKIAVTVKNDVTGVVDVLRQE